MFFRAGAEVFYGHSGADQLAVGAGRSCWLLFRTGDNKPITEG